MSKRSSKRRKILIEYAEKHLEDTAHDPLSVKTTRYINGVGYEAFAVPLAPEVLRSHLANYFTPNEGRTVLEQFNESIVVDSDSSPNLDNLDWAADNWVADMQTGLDEALIESEPVPEDGEESDTEGCSPDDTDRNAELRRLILHALVAQESPSTDIPVCAMSECQNRGEFECRDCDGPGIVCQQCLLTSHRHQVLHRPHKWNGKYFERTSLSMLGLIMHLGHGDQLCSHMATGGGPYCVTVVDVNGVHEVNMGWCRCNDAPSFAEQLLARKLLPGSVLRPRTAFTFRLLRLFHMLHHSGRINPWDFSGAMHRLTDNVIVGSIPSTYQSFNNVQRQWRMARALKRAGKTDLQEAIADGELCVPCVSCPIPGINLPKDWETETNAELRNTVFIGGDGNFRLRRNNKGGGQVTDPSLFGDHAFYAPNEDYKAFNRARGGAPDDTSDITCRGFRAGNAVNTMNSHNKPTSGCLCLSCVRSGAFLPQGTVDLAKGERFVNFDFPLTHVLKRLISLGIKRVVVSYDIACKYHIHFLKRVSHPDWPLLTETEVKKVTNKDLEIIWLVPKFHLAAHIEGCADKFSFNWTKNVGRTCGELVESNWASMNLLATSTREMGFGHRRDTLMDAQNDWNWRKAIREPTRILRSTEEIIAMLLRRRTMLQNLEAVLGPDKVAQLVADSEERDGSQYRSRGIEVPSRVEILKHMQSEEAEKNSACVPAISVGGIRSARLSGSIGINMGLDLEIRQESLRCKISDAKTTTTGTQRRNVEESRKKFAKALDAWFAGLVDFMPPDALHMNIAGEITPENEKLRLPSDFKTDTHEALGLTVLAETEYQLRLGLLNDSLKQLRKCLGLKAFLVRRKYNLASGQKVLTRSEAAIDRAASHVRKWREIYKRCRSAVIQLKGEKNVPKQYQILKDSDCVMLGEWLDEHTFWQTEGQCAEFKAGTDSQGRRELPWIWKMNFEGIVNPDELTKAVDEWSEEATRLEWVHARASVHRLEEEVILLHAESERVGKTFDYFQRHWKGQADTWRCRRQQGEVFKNGGVQRGAEAAAHRKVAMFARLARAANRRFEEVEALIRKEGLSLSIYS